MSEKDVGSFEMKHRNGDTIFTQEEVSVRTAILHHVKDVDKAIERMKKYPEIWMISTPHALYRWSEIGVYMDVQIRVSTRNK